LTGDEIRGCWEAMPAELLQDPVPLTIGPARPIDDARPPLAFVEVSATAPVASATAAAEDASAPGVEDPPIASGLPAAREPAWNLWGDLET
jgi:hypothetical protein